MTDDIAAARQRQFKAIQDRNEQADIAQQERVAANHTQRQFEHRVMNLAIAEFRQDLGLPEGGRSPSTAVLPPPGRGSGRKT